MRIYREHFTATEIGNAPRTLLSTFTVAADDEAQALRHAKPAAAMFDSVVTGANEKLLSAEEAEVVVLSANSPGSSLLQNGAIGTPDQVRAKLDALADRSGADELTLLTIVHSHDARMRSYGLIAAEYGDRLAAV